MNNNRIDPSTLDEYVCPLCYQPFLALFLYLDHARRQHGERLAPLSPQEGTVSA